MIRKTIGILMIIGGGIIFVMLLSGGGSLLPHIVGPITLEIVGIILLLSQRKGHKKIMSD